MYIDMLITKYDDTFDPGNRCKANCRGTSATLG